MEPDVIFHTVARRGDLAPGEVRHIEIGGREIGLFNVDGEFFAIDDICTHMRARLSDGYIDGAIVECPLHFGKFDIRTGRAASAPCTVDAQSYPVRLAADIVSIGIPA